MCFFLLPHIAGSCRDLRTSRRSLKVSALSNNLGSAGHFSEANVQFDFKNGRKHFSPLLREGERAELDSLELNYSIQRLLSLLGK